MLEIKNKKRFPVQLVIKSAASARSFTVLNIPGVGSGKNIYFLEDEKATPYIDKAEKEGLITVKNITNKLRKGE